MYTDLNRLYVASQWLASLSVTWSRRAGCRRCLRSWASAARTWRSWRRQVARWRRRDRRTASRNQYVRRGCSESHVFQTRRRTTVDCPCCWSLLITASQWHRISKQSANLALANCITPRTDTLKVTSKRYEVNTSLSFYLYRPDLKRKKTKII